MRKEIRLTMKKKKKKITFLQWYFAQHLMTGTHFFKHINHKENTEKEN